STSMTLTIAASGVRSSWAAFSTNSRSLWRARSRSVTSSTIRIALSVDVGGSPSIQKKLRSVSTSVPPGGGPEPKRVAANSLSEKSGHGSGSGSPGESAPSRRSAAGFAYSISSSESTKTTPWGSCAKTRSGIVAPFRRDPSLSMIALLLGQKANQHLRVRRRLCDESILLVLGRFGQRRRRHRRTAVVVEHRIDGLRLAGELLQPRHPFAQLFRGVEVVEALGRASCPLVPGLGVAAVEADVGGFARGG